MTAKELIQRLLDKPDAEVVIHQGTNVMGNAIVSSVKTIDATGARARIVAGLPNPEG